MSARQVLKKIHLWLSVPVGLFITLICFSGAMMVFEKEITQLCQREVYYVKDNGGDPLPVGVLVEKVASTLPDSVSVTGINITPQRDKAWQVTLSKPRRASVYVNQYTGEVTGAYKRLGFFDTMFHLHRWLMGSSSKPDGGICWGKMIVGVSVLFLVFILISGIIIWWPRKGGKPIKERFIIHCNKGWGRFFHDLHVAGGIYVVLFVLLMAVTGLTWSFKWYNTGFYKLLGVDTTTEVQHGGGSANQASEGRAEHRSHTLDWQNIYEQMVEKYPDYRQITVSDASAAVVPHNRINLRASDKYTFDKRSGKITGVSLYKDQDRAAKVRSTVYTLHTGSWGGLITRIIAFISALIGATLPLTGYFLWIHRLLRKKER